MIRALWFAIRVGVLIAIAVWIANRPGMIKIEWLGYEITAQVGFILLVLFLFLLVSLLIYRLFLFVFSLGKVFKRYKEKTDYHKGQRAIALGLSAVAAGDSKLASYQATRVKKLVPDDQGLALFLEAQALRLDGDVAGAQGKFENLVNSQDTAFLGLRGLMMTAIECGDVDQALNVAKRALKLHPKQKWIVKAVYDLQIRAQKWDDALITLSKAKKIKAIDDEKAIHDHAAILIQQAINAQNSMVTGQGSLSLLKKAYRLAPGFLPAAIEYSQALSALDKRSAALKIIEKTWKVSPHPELADLWSKFRPKSRKGSKHLSVLPWYEKLVSFNPKCEEGQLAAAEAALSEGLWGEARQYLVMAEQLAPSSNVYRVWAKLEERLGDKDKANMYLEKATQCKPGKVWICKDSGNVYEKWKPIAEPHGSFNSIKWDYPNPLYQSDLLESHKKNDLLISA
jgi:HemY protein